MPDKVNKSLEKGKIIEKDIEKYKITSLINDCLNIENNILNINKINANIKNFKSTEKKLYFFKSQKAFDNIIKCITTNLKLENLINESEIINGEKFEQINEWLGGILTSL